ncbi:MAG: CBS domain-containing protein [Propionivibrio sp.]|nr:CBS domain-containing protein [Propionivibrio sp.]
MPDSNTSSPVAPFSPFAILRNLVRVAPLTVAPSASVRETLTKLDAARTDAIVVVDEASHVPLGIVTLRDVLRRIAIEAGDLEAPIAVIMTGGLITLPASATAHQASVIMVRRGVRHLVLTEPDGSYFNVVSQADLYAQTGARVSELVSANSGIA